MHKELVGADVESDADQRNHGRRQHQLQRLKELPQRHVEGSRNDVECGEDIEFQAPFHHLGVVGDPRHYIVREKVADDAKEAQKHNSNSGQLQPLPSQVVVLGTDRLRS